MTEDDENERHSAQTVQGGDARHRSGSALRSGMPVTLSVVLMAVIWLLILLHLGLWRASVRPAPGLLSYTFEGWEQFAPSRHAFMAQYDGTEFGRNIAYTSFGYPFLFAMFAVVAPLHVLFDVPYTLAHNIVPYVFVAALTLLLIVTARGDLLDARERPAPARSALIFLGVGILVTNSLP